jgi:RNA polymerase sigma factor (sigma-70 family)
MNTELNPAERWWLYDDRSGESSAEGISDLSASPSVAMLAIMHADMERVEKYLDGNTEVLGELREEIDPILFRTFVCKCVDPEIAKEILATIWSECIPGIPGKQECLLEKYSGQAALKSYLTKVALNRYLDYRRRLRDVDLTTDDSSHEENLDALGSKEVWAVHDDALAQILRTALEAAFRACSPEGLLMCRLCARYSIRQKELAPIWNCDEATISRRMDKAMEVIRSTVPKELERLEPGLKLGWDDVLELCRASGGFGF